MNYLEKQNKIVDLFNRLKKNNKLSHAYIFETENYEEGLYLAKYFACLLLCKNDIPCMECSICKRVFNNEHLNVTTIEPINNVIKKEQITNLIEDFSNSALEEGSLIYIINHSECLNPSSSNTLLKFLEEPLPNRYAIIITNNHSLLLDTIISRAQIIHFENTEPIDIYNNYLNLGYSNELSFVLSHIKDNIEIDKETVEKIYNISLKLFNKIVYHYSIFTTFMTEKKDIKEKYEYQLLIDILIILFITYIKYINGEKTILDEIYSKLKDKNINKQIACIDILSEYKYKLNYNINTELQVSSMFIDIEKEVYND